MLFYFENSHVYIIIIPMERCLRGRKSTIGNRVYAKTYRGFESLSLRQKRSYSKLGNTTFDFLSKNIVKNYYINNTTTRHHLLYNSKIDSAMLFISSATKFIFIESSLLKSKIFIFKNLPHSPPSSLDTYSIEG